MTRATPPSWSACPCVMITRSMSPTSSPPNAIPDFSKSNDASAPGSISVSPSLSKMYAQVGPVCECPSCGTATV